MLSGEEHAAVRAREPRAQLRIVGRAERGIASLGPGIILPRDGAAPKHSRASWAQPLELRAERLGATRGEELLHRRRSAATGKETEDAGGRGLFLVRVPQRADSEIGPEGSRSLRRSPEPAVVLGE